MPDPADDRTDRPRRFSVALLGGLRIGGRPRLGDRIVRLALIGGMDLDLTGAEFAANRLTIVKISLIGGLVVRVPTDARVEVHGFALGGRHVEDGRSRESSGEVAAPGPSIAIYAFGLLGGVKVRRRPA